MEIHIQLAGIQLGPYSEKQVREYLADGLLSLTDKAREEGSLDWIEVSEMVAKFPPPADPPPPANPDSIFVDETPEPPPEPEPKRAPEAPPGVNRLPSRLVDSKKVSLPAVVEALANKTLAIGPTAPGLLAKGPTASSSVATTTPLAQSTKKMSRTALAKALQNRTEPLPSRASTSTIPPKAAEAEPTTDTPAEPTVTESIRPAQKEVRKGGGLSSMLRSLTAKTVPMRSGPPVTPAPTAPAPADPPPSSPPLPGGRTTMPITAPLPTKAILSAAELRAKRPPAPPVPELEPATERLPVSKKAAELRAKAQEKAAAQTSEPTSTPPPTAPTALEPVDEPAAPKRKSYSLIYAFGVLAILGVYYVWSPYHAASSLRDAMTTGSSSDLDGTINFVSIRDTLKQQVQTAAANSPMQGSQASTDALTMIDNSIDLYVTPQGISSLVNKNGQFPPDSVAQSISPEVAGDVVASFISQPVRNQGLASFNDFVLQTDVAQMHLKFHGLNWKLERIDVRTDQSGSSALAPVVATYLNRGHTAAGKSDWGQAISNYTQALTIDPHSSVAYNERAAARQSKNDLDGAIKDYTQALTIDPQMATAYKGRGNARAAKNDLDGAIADFTQAVKIDPTLATAYDSRGNAKTSKDDLDGAIADYTQAITIDPTLASAYSDRGFARQANGNLDGAISDYTQALALQPKTAFAYYNRGLARQSQGNLEAAIIDYDRALAFDPKMDRAYYNRANAKNALHDIDGAIADYTQAIDLNPKVALPYCNRGLARQAKGDLDGAIADYTQSLSIDPKIAVAYFQRGLIKEQKGDFDGTIADTSQSLDLDPKNTQAYFHRGFAKLAKGNLDGALTDLKTFCDSTPRDRFTNNARLYLWLIAKTQNSKSDADQELSDALENNWNTSSDDFTSKTAAYLLGRVTESDYLTAASSTDGSTDAAQHCQAWYFSGMKRLMMGDRGTAVDYFQKCVATNKSDFCEYILAKAELQGLLVPAATPTPAPAPATTPMPVLKMP